MEVQLNLLLSLIIPIIHSKPIRAMIPIGARVGTDTGGVGGASATTTKPGDPLPCRRRRFGSHRSRYRICRVRTGCARQAPVRSRHSQRMQSDFACDILWDLIAIVPVRILDVCFCSCGVYVFVRMVSVLWFTGGGGGGEERGDGERYTYPYCPDQRCHLHERDVNIYKR